uniref:RNA helicase n=1 Tax=Meloidogyne javanica TaxID=6303 RepID=A0A915MVW9_MELJA
MTSARRVFGDGRCSFNGPTLNGNEKDYIKFSDFVDYRATDFERVKRDYGDYFKWSIIVDFLGFNREGSEEMRLPRMRRQKFVPQNKSELDLFNVKEHIQQHFDELFGAEHDDEIIVSTDRGDLFNYRITKFDQCGFSKEIEKNIKLRKYEFPTPIQRAVIPLVMRSRQDIMGHAQTGSGKTAAFILPIINEIQRIVDLKRNNLGNKANSLVNKDSPYCIILSPTRELAQQLYEETRSFVARTNVSVAQSYGDIPMRHTLDLKDQGCDIFVVTCGRLRHHVMDGHIKLACLRYFVLDEADKLIKDRQFFASVDEVKSHPNLYPDNRMLLFSATFSNDVQMLAQNHLKTGYYFIRIGKMNKAVDLIRQEFIEVKKHDKLELLVEMLKKNSVRKILPNGDEYLVPEFKTIVFVEEKRDSDRIAIALVYHKFKVMSINGDRSQKQRSEALEKFKRGIFHILVATNVLARGVNIPDVKHVV